MSSSTRRLCQSWLASLPAWSAVALRGKGVTLSVVSRALLCPLVLAELPDLHAAGRLSDQQERRVTQLLAELSPRIESDLRIIRAGVDEGLRLGQELGVEVSARDLADKVTRVVRKAGGGQAAEAAMAGSLKAYIESRPPLGRVLSRREFARFEPYFDRLWQEQGARHLADFSWSRLGLGDDEPPPFVVAERESTWLGLGRSVYSRFRIAARDSAVKGSAAEVAEAEIQRSCGRLGLATEASLVTLCSLSVGLLYGPVGYDWRPPRDTAFDASWRDDKAPLAPRPQASADPLLPRGEWVHADLAAYAQACVAAFLVGTRQGALLRHAGLVERAHQHVMRRAWMMCFESERRGITVDARRASRIVSYSIFKAIPAGEANHLKLANSGLRPVAEPTSAALDPELVGKVLEWLAANPELARSLLDVGDLEAEREYAQAAERLGLPSLERLLGEFGRG